MYSDNQYTIEHNTLNKVPYTKNIHAIALLSGGLDSLLAAKLIMEQGLNVHCIHNTSPFFGKPNQVKNWETLYGLSIEAIDISHTFIQMLRKRPKHGFGKNLNPCLDCKIIMMQIAYSRMKKLGASFIISGEIIGQRPMSQRKDALAIILKDAKVHDILLRPLCAQHLPETEPERSGLVDRSKLLALSGRSRKKQLALAKQIGIEKIPSPAGGCLLAEKAYAHRYWPVLTKIPTPTTQDFTLANVGRQYWYNNHWLIIGRNQEDNKKIEELASSNDIIIRLVDIPGPTALAKQITPWSEDILHDAAALAISYAHKALSIGQPLSVSLYTQKQETIVKILPKRMTSFPWEQTLFEDMKKGLRKENTLGQKIDA